MKKIWWYVIAFIMILAISAPFYLYTGISPKGSSTQDSTITIKAGQEISIQKLHIKGSSNYFTWDDGNKLAFDRGFIVAKIKTHAPTEPGIHKLVVTKDLFYFRIPRTYYYLVN